MIRTTIFSAFTPEKKSKFTDFSSVLSLLKAVITGTLKTAERFMEKVIYTKQTLKSSLIYVVWVKKSRQIKSSEFDWMYE